MVPLLPTVEVPVCFGDRAYTVREWQPGDPLPYQHSAAYGIDTETEELISGVPIVPVIVQVAAAGSDIVLFARAEHYSALLCALDTASPNAMWVFFNAPFDCKVLGWPDEPLWGLMTQNRLVDMEIRGALHELQAGTYMDKMNLDHLTWSLLKVKLDKDKEVQLSFHPHVTLTQRQVSYAAQDALATLLSWEQLPEALPTEELNIRGYFALTAISDLGIRRDEVRRKELDDQMLDEQTHTHSVLRLFGIAPALVEAGREQSSPGVQLRKDQLLHSIERNYGVTLLRSPKTDRIVTDKKALDLQLIVNKIPIPIWLGAARQFEHARKMRSTYLKSDMVGADGRVHPRFSPLLRTGRTSCSGPNIQNMPRKGGIRGIYIPSDGYLFIASDYSQLELCALAQACYDRFGKSVMGDLINADVDVHLWLGGEIGRKTDVTKWVSPEMWEACSGKYDLSDKKDPIAKYLRQLAKVPNFGLPGGLGAATLVAFAQNYGVQLSIDQAKELIALWFESFPEMRDHLQADVDDYWTNRAIQIWLKEHKIDRPARNLREFEYVLGKYYTDDEDTVRRTLNSLTAYVVTTVSGRTKRNCTFCSAANMRFQAPSADGAKIALWEGYVRGWRVVNFIHDEIIQEVLKSWSIEHLTDFVDNEVSPVMVESMRQILPRMKIKVETALMDRWYKEAEPLRDDKGHIMLWTPPVKGPVTQLEASRLKDPAAAA